MSVPDILLRKITEKDTANILKWRNAREVRVNLYTQTELTEEQHLNWLKNYVRAGLCAQYIIVVSENGIRRDIGSVFIKNIDRQSHKGEFGMFIGEASARGKGYAKYAAKEMLRLAFHTLSLNRVYLTVLSDNAAAIKAYQNAGFDMEGTLKEDYFRENAYVDVLVMGITKTSWEKKENPAVS